ncbi:MAG: bifunctional methylenetetrahydrofolate dehydrogenase/methenyltetrahydrofolate cyclohydrolase FolD [Rickettsiales bacterium]|jgi:methylenetetrahydrofolate dehydrogenase (NADP+) / methenyltetrahydrofolate cyclohydrolase|nr:bifunctional methylenetetrahydrofolate dehydrogenase/methenyltetrahydrofolate cyclohydrolase FolD [Rickettsiales bacterium]
MSASIINGKKISEELVLSLRDQVTQLKQKYEQAPCLKVIIVGANPASSVYVSHKDKQAKAIGINSEIIRLSEDVSEAELLAKINDLNQDAEVNGILVQLPLPKHIDNIKVIDSIEPNKDVDGFHASNTGRLYTYQSCFVPCTPQGCMLLLKTVKEDLSGLNAVIIGRSNIVGKPMAELLLQANCTTTIVHSRTKDLESHTLNADIIVAAVGIPKMLNSSNVKKGAIVIDVGINRIIDSEGKSRLVGDCHFESLKDHAVAITPVPGGVGPMTVACLMKNTILAFLAQNKYEL